MATRTVDGGTVTIDGVTLPVLVRINPRARRLILRLTHTRTVTITCPSAQHMPDAMRMLESQRRWISAQLAATPSPVPLTTGSVLPVLGEPRVVVADSNPSAAARLTPHRILVGGRDDRARHRRIERLLRDTVRTEIITQAHDMAHRLGVSLATISVRDMTSRWGSCGDDGALCFNWRLVFAPRHVLNYVVAHEVAHRREMNHSRAFWAQVRHLDPDYKTAVEWLTHHGATLHAYGLADQLDRAA